MAASNPELAKLILRLVFAGEPTENSEKGIRQVRSLVNEVIEKDGRYERDQVRKQIYALREIGLLKTPPHHDEVYRITKAGRTFIGV